MNKVYKCPTVKVVELDDNETLICTSTTTLDGGDLGNTGDHSESKSRLLYYPSGDSKEDGNEW